MPLVDDFLRFVSRGPGIATLLSPMRFMGLPMGRRTVRIRHDAGQLLINPGRLEGEQVDAITADGAVTDILVPTGFHDTFLKENREQFPEARFHLSPKLLSAFERIVHRSGRDDPPAFAAIDRDALAAITPDLIPFPLDGMPWVQETVFVHRPSRCLIVSDLLFWIPPEFGFASRLFARLNGIARQAGPSFLERAMVRDKAAFRASLDVLLEQDFDTILPSHFACVPAGGKAIIRAIRDGMA